MDIEREYNAVDFSRFSKVKESLRARLHQERQKAVSYPLGRVELDLDDLDYVAAAGTGTPPQLHNPWDKGRN